MANRLKIQADRKLSEEQLYEISCLFALKGEKIFPEQEENVAIMNLWAEQNEDGTLKWTKGEALPHPTEEDSMKLDVALAEAWAEYRRIQL